MNRRADIAAAASLLGLIWSAASGQEVTSALGKNPFSRPDFVVELGEAPVATRIAIAEPIELELRATLVADGQAFADINGEILSAGQTFEGHRVVHVAEGRAVLTRDGERVELDLFENQAGSDGQDD